MHVAFPRVAIASAAGDRQIVEEKTHGGRDV
jgi:hypothetical protein